MSRQRRRPPGFAAALIVALGVLLVASGCVPTGGGPGTLKVTELDAPASVAQWGLFEAGISVSPKPANPFDPADADVRATFVDPHGASHPAIGFWFQNYSRALVNGAEQLTPQGDPYFDVRFTPTEPGTWTWSWSVHTTDGTVNTTPRTFVVTPHAGHGFIRRSPHDERYLSFDDGSSYFAVGENVGWYDARGTFDYDNWFDQLAKQHANFARLWMPSWAFGIEWKDTGLGDYTKRLDRAWQLDEVLDAAQARGIYVELSLLNHGAFSTAFNSEWTANPYNAANGGPLTAPAQFFTDATAQHYFEQRLRYIVARWGYSTDLVDWELWNEVDLTDGYNSANVTAWHQTMAAQLRALDANHHLVSSSDAVFVSDPNMWNNGGLDFTQIHFYTNPLGILPDLSSDVVSMTHDRVTSTGKPVLFAELGVNSDSAAATKSDDPGGIGVHDGLWAGVVSQGFGTAMTWWWDNLIDAQPDLYYPMFGSVAKFVDGVQFDREGFMPVSETATTGPSDPARPLVVYDLWGSNTGLLWVKDDAYQFKTAQQVDINGATVTLNAPGKDNWCGRWYDTWNGTWLASVTVPVGTTTIPVPPFHGDIALRLGAC